MKGLKKKVLCRITAILMVVCATLGAFPLSAMAKDATNVKVGFYFCDGYHEITDEGTRTGCGVDLLYHFRRNLNHTYTFVDFAGD